MEINWPAQRVVSILGALGTAQRRSIQSVGSFTNNNLFFLGVVLLFFGDPGAFASLAFLILLVVFFPLCADPLRKAPRSRLAGWPLARAELWLIRTISVWLNPISLLLAGLAVRRKVTLGLWTLLAAALAAGWVGPILGEAFGGTARRGFLRPMPPAPGRLGQLMRKNLRGLLSTLDFYAALLVSAAGFGFRAAGYLPPEAHLPLTLLAMLAFSTPAQNLFGLDGAGGLARYRLLPLAGWRILAAKDAVYFAAAIALALPLDPLAGCGAALAALALGHRDSIRRYHPDARWRFATSTSFGSSLVQMVVIGAAGAAVDVSILLLAPCALAYAWSTWWYGRAWAGEGAWPRFGRAAIC
jgi:hypothetical protein